MCNQYFHNYATLDFYNYKQNQNSAPHFNYSYENKAALTEEKNNPINNISISSSGIKVFIYLDKFEEFQKRSVIMSTFCWFWWWWLIGFVVFI